MIIVDANGQNSIVLSAGANGKVSIEDIESASFADFKLLQLQLEIPTPIVVAAARRAREKGLRVSLNPEPAKDLPEELITLTDYLIPNETELSLLSGMAVHDIASAEQAAKSMLSRGVKNVIVTLGSKGALIVSGSETDHIESFKVDVVDTTAAGDDFIGGFAYKLLESSNSPPEKKDHTSALRDAVRYGCAGGTLAATKFGAQPSLPTTEEVENFLSLGTTDGRKAVTF